MSEVLDQQTDPQIEAIGGLLFAVLRAKLGVEAVARVYHWPVRIELVPTLQVPALAVYRLTDQLVAAADAVEDVDAANIRIDYYAPVTPLDRIDLRWPLLRRAWRICRGALQVGWHLSYVDALDQPISLSSVGFDVPAAIGGNVAYQTAPADAGVVPMFSATISLRSSDFVDLTDYPVDDLETVVTNAFVDPAVDSDPNAHAYESIVDDLDVP